MVAGAEVAERRAGDVSANQNPCKKDCRERSPTCHAECERYKTYAELKRQEREVRYVESQAMRVHCEGFARRSGYNPQQ